MPFAHKRFGGNGNITHCCKSLQKTTAKFSSNPRISFLRKSTRKDPPVKSDQNKAISVHVLWGSFRHRSTPVLWSRHQKINFLHYISVTAVKCTIVHVQRNEPGRSIPYCARPGEMTVYRLCIVVVHMQYDRYGSRVRPLTLLSQVALLGHGCWLTR